VFVTGDPTRIDLKRGEISGVIEATRILDGEGIFATACASCSGIKLALRPRRRERDDEIRSWAVSVPRIARLDARQRVPNRSAGVSDEMSAMRITTPACRLPAAGDCGTTAPEGLTLYVLASAHVN
jgi:hypothetical protein